MFRFERYIEQIQSGKVRSGKLVKLAIERHLLDMKRKDVFFDYDHAEKVIKLCEVLRFWEGSVAGKRITLEDWQIFYIASLFGWKRTDTGYRKYTQNYVEVARKNGKTTLLALISLIHLLIDKEPASQVWCGATKEDQARILVNDAGRIVEATPEARKKFKMFKYKDLITRVSFPSKNGFIAALGRDSRTQDGFNPSMGNIDEFHEHQTMALLNVISSGMGSRMQPMLNIITTAGFNKENPCYSVTRKTGIEILNGVKKDDSYFVLIYEPDDDDDWKDPKNWIKSNPNLGVSVREEFLKDRLKTALNERGSTEVNFKTKHLNIWTDAPRVWIPDEVWMKGALPPIEGYYDRIAYGGLDLSKNRDLNAFVLLFPDNSGGFDVKCWFWLPEEVLAASSRTDYWNWRESGLIRATSGDVMRPDEIAADILEICAKYNVASIAYDPYLATHGAVQRITDNNVEMCPIAQNIRSLSPYTKEFERLVYSKNLRHDGHSVLRWMMSNVVIQTDQNGNIKCDKQKSGNKIDGIAALINAIAQFIDFGINSNDCLYNHQNIRII